MSAFAQGGLDGFTCRKSVPWDGRRIRRSTCHGDTVGRKSAASRFRNCGNRVPCNDAALQSAITNANTLGVANIRLAPYCTYNTATTLTVTGNITIVGGPATVVRATAPVVIFIVAANGTLRAQGLFILGGTGVPGLPGGIGNSGTLVLDFMTFSGNFHSAVANVVAGARAFIARTLFTGSQEANVAGAGGAIANFGRLTLFQSRVVGSTAPSAGGVWTGGGGSTRIVQSTIEGNTATTLGGGVFNSPGGTTTIDRSLIQLNSAGTGGGGIANQAAAEGHDHGPCEDHLALNSAPPPLRGPLGVEGRVELRVVVAVHQQCLGHGLQLQRAGQAHVLLAGQERLGLGVRLRRSVGQPPRQASDGGVQLALLDERADQTDPLGLLRADGVAQHEELRRAAKADEPRQEVRRAHVGARQSRPS